jgi:hypothetical protein
VQGVVEKLGRSREGVEEEWGRGNEWSSASGERAARRQRGRGERGGFLCKDSLRIIMTLVAYYNLELHQMDVKTIFLNGDMLKNVYMTQPKYFVMKEKEHMGCHLRKSIYGLKQASRQWYLKFDETIRSFGFKENKEDNCIYAKFKSGKFIFLILYVDDILLTSSDVSLLLEIKRFLSSIFYMKDLGEASFILGIEIHRDRRNEVLELSQKAYLEKALNKFSQRR